MNYKIIIIVMLIGFSLIGTTLAANSDSKFDEHNKTLIIKDSLKNSDFLKIKQVSSQPDLVSMEEVFEITSYENYTFKNTKDFNIRWQKYGGKNDIIKANWEILKPEGYDVTLPDFELIEKSKEIPNILSYTNVTDVYDLNPWMLDWGVNSNEKWEISTSEVKGTIGFDRYEITSTNPLNITFFWYEHQQTGSHQVTRYRDEWEPFSPDGKTIKQDESITVKLTFSKIAETGKHSIKTIPRFAGIEVEKFTWWNASWDFRIDNPIPNGVRPYQLSLTLSNAIGSNDATHVFFNGHSNTDFSDVRFTLDNTTPLSYWIEKGTGKVWVNVTANGIVNLYYGNPSATDASNGKKTFEFFDDFEPESWQKLLKLPKPHADQAGAVLDGKIYTIGGYDTSYTAPTGLVWAYDPVTNSYSQKKDLTFARWGPACTGYSGNIYCFGGLPNHKTEKYYPGNNTWITLSEPPLPLQEQGLTAVVGGSYIYLFRAGNLYKYNPITDIYTLLNNAPPQNIQNWPAMAFYNNEIYILGGYYNSNGINYVQIYNLNNNVWRNGAPMPIGLYGTLRENPIINNKIYILQGQGIWNNYDFYSRYWVYNIITNSWDWGELGYWDADGVSGGVIGNKVYTFGGRRGHGTDDRGTTFAGVLDTSKNIQAKWIDVKIGAWREDYSYLTNGLGQRYPTVQIRTAERVVNTNSKVISRMKYSSGSTGYGGLIIQSNGGVYGSNNNGYLDPFISITANRDELRKQTGSSSDSLLGTRSLASPDVWHTYTSYYDPSSIKSTRDGANNIVVSDGTYRGGYIQVMKSIGFDLLIDYIAVARYVPNEPSWAIWSQEPSSSNPPGPSNSISFIDPTPANGATLSKNYAFINTQASGVSTAFIDWNRNLIGWWRFNGESGENSILFRDWSSWGNNAACSGTSCPTSTPGKFGNALDFDGSNDYVTAPNSANLNPSSITLEAWFNADSGGLAGQKSLIQKPYTSQAAPYYQYMLSLADTAGSPKAAEFYLAVNGVMRYVETKNLGYNYGQWHYLAGTYDGSTMTMYLDGNIVGSTPIIGTITPYNTILEFGAYPNLAPSSSNVFNGKLDEPRIHSRALSPEEIKASYNAGIYRLSNNFTNLATGVYNYRAYGQDLSGNVIQTETRSLSVTVNPDPSGLVISNIAAISGKVYGQDTLSTGKLFYIDRTYTFTSVPPSYAGLNYIKTSTDDRYRTESNFLQFDVNKDVTVYVAYDDRISPKPSWLTSFFTDTGDNIVRDDSSTFSIYSRNYPAGHISLGGTAIPSGGAGGSYVVILKPQGSPSPSTLVVSISESPDPVISGGTSQVTVQVTSGGVNAAGANVGLSITGGSLSSSTGTTDASGKFTVTYTAPSVTTSTTHTISATASKTGFVSGSGSDLITVSPVSSGLMISNIVAASGKTYIKDILAIGKLFYIDRTYTFTSVPPSYAGLYYIKTSTDDRYRTESNFLQFDVNKDVTVYIAYDDRISPKPSWLTSFFTDTGDNIVRDDSSTFSIYSRNYPAGHISLGGTAILSGGAGGSYVVILKPQGSPSPSTLVVSISESPDPVISGGTSQVTVQVSSGGVNAAGANVGLSITGGSLSSSTGTTDASGKFTVTYTAPSVTTSTTHTISATASKTGFVSGSGSDLITVSPVSSGLMISNIVAASGKTYIKDILAIGKLFYIDRTYTFTSVPPSYIGLNYIKTSTDDRYRTESNFLQFDVNKDVTVYVVYDDRISPKPSWLTSVFTDTGNNIVRDDSSTFSIYSRNYPAGHISLGGTSIPSGGVGGGYVVIVK